MTTIQQVVAIVVGIFGVCYTVFRVWTYFVNWLTKLGARMDQVDVRAGQMQDAIDKSTTQMKASMEQSLSRHDKYHTEHYTAIGDLETSVATLGQKVTDHDVRDNDRFHKLETTCEGIRTDMQETRKEIGDSIEGLREDIKILLQR